MLLEWKLCLQRGSTHGWLANERASLARFFRILVSCDYLALYCFLILIDCIGKNFLEDAFEDLVLNYSLVGM